MPLAKAHFARNSQCDGPPKPESMCHYLEWPTIEGNAKAPDSLHTYTSIRTHKYDDSLSEMEKEPKVKSA